MKSPDRAWRYLRPETTPEYSNIVEHFKYGSIGGEVIDTSVRGNWNGGHEYGVELPATDKAALLAYLLTL
jgi:hypothetical protein